MNEPGRSTSRRAGADRLASWGWFVGWTAVGAAAAIGSVSFALWPLLVPLGIAGAIVLGVTARARGSAAGLLTGVGLALLLVAFIQRDGPGTTCHRTATGGSCTEHLDPRPWLAVGLAFALGGVLLNLWVRWSTAGRASAS